MAYGDSTLGADHRWSFNNVLTDSIGSMTITNTGGAFVTTPITRDATHSYQTNGRDDLATVAPTSDTGSVALSQYAVGGWFMVSGIQGPPCCIYKQGGTNGFALFLWAGNNIMLQMKINGGATIRQVFSDIAITSNRSYHFLIRFSGSGEDDTIRFFLDGVEQLSTKDGNAVGQTTMDAHTGVHAWGENGTTGTEVQVGTEGVLIKAPVNGFWAEWWTWEGADAALTDNEVREEIFAPGCIPDLTISSDTEANMQTALDAIADTVRPDEGLCILVEEVSGGGDLDLSADNITFNSRASIHVRYEGTGTLNWTNTNGSNASLGSGNVVFLNPAQLTINSVQNPTEVRVYAAGTQNELAGEESVTTGTFSATISQSPIDIRFLSLDYQMSILKNIAITSDLTIDVSQFVDRQYENP